MIKLLAVEEPFTQILQEEKTMNFLHNAPRLGEVKLQLVKILTLTKEMEETVEFEKILLTLLLKHEWNNQLQNIAVSYYRDLSYNENPHSSYVFQPIFLSLGQSSRNLSRSTSRSKRRSLIFRSPFREATNGSSPQ